MNFPGPISRQRGRYKGTHFEEHAFVEFLPRSLRFFRSLCWHHLRLRDTDPGKSTAPLCEGSDDDDVFSRRFPQACIRTCTCLDFVARLYVYNPQPFPRKLDDHSQDSFLYKVYSFLWTRGLSFLGVLRWAGPFGARWVFRLSGAVCCCRCCCCCLHIKNHPGLVSIKHLLLSQHLRTNPPLFTRPI